MLSTAARQFSRRAQTRQFSGESAKVIYGRPVQHQTTTKADWGGDAGVSFLRTLRARTLGI